MPIKHLSVVELYIFFRMLAIFIEQKKHLKLKLKLQIIFQKVMWLSRHQRSTKFTKFRFNTNLVYVKLKIRFGYIKLIAPEIVIKNNSIYLNEVHKILLLIKQKPWTHENKVPQKYITQTLRNKISTPSTFCISESTETKIYVYSSSRGFIKKPPNFKTFNLIKIARSFSQNDLVKKKLSQHLCTHKYPALAALYIITPLRPPITAVPFVLLR